MDLAEIRKKARSGKGAGVNYPAIPKESLGRPSASIQGVPEKTAPAGIVASVPAPLAEKSPPATPREDPLDVLFRLHPDFNLATEETYLGGLAEKEKEAAANLRQWLTFPLGKEEYALDIENVREIIKPREVSDIPRAPDFVLGIISLRGIILPVFDLKKRLKLGKVDASPASRIIVCQDHERIAGLLVENITQVVRLPDAGIEPPPAVLSGLDRDLVEGVGRHQGRMMILLHLANVLDAELS
jgi:purine-binding chemotaxis protein CheW